MKEKIYYRYVFIEEYFKKINNKIYLYWRFKGENKWNRRLTPYKEIPYVKIRI